MGTGIALPSTHPIPTTRVHPPPTRLPVRTMKGVPRGLNMVVGLKSVEQLTLVAHFSGFQGITEVYNLRIAGNPNNHKLIPGTE